MANDNPADDEDKRRQNQINFMVEQQARIDANLESVTERLDRLADQQALTSARLDRLTENVNVFVGETRQAFNNLIGETREGFNNLIVANEGTRELAQQVARLAVETSRRVTELEKK